MKKYILTIVLFLTGLVLNSCGDDVPTDYKPENFVEAVLIVGEPIRGIIVMRTQPVTAKFNYYNSLIKDAEVVIKGEGREFKLDFNTDTLAPGYYSPESTYLVKANTKYSISIKLNDGSLLSGETTTPGQVEWAQKIKSQFQFPFDTLKLPATDTIFWTNVADVNFYNITIKCLDTLEYGKYLTPQTNEKNRRVYKPFINDEEYYYDRSEIAFIPNTKSSVVWNVFKWFGKHEVYISAPDWNYTRWFLQHVSSSQVNPLLGSIEGGIGVFGSMSVARDTVVLLKNRP